MADTVSVTQEDRALFFDLFEISEGNRERVMRGDEDKRPQMQRIAAFRLASTQPAPAFPREEVAAAVWEGSKVAGNTLSYEDLREIDRKPYLRIADAVIALLQGKKP